MSLLYITEHTSCNNYVSSFNTGFNICNLEKDEKLVPSRIDYNCLIFSLSGTAVLFYDATERTLRPNSVVFIPMSRRFEIKADDAYKSIIHYFNMPVELCEKLTFESLATMTESKIFYPLDNIDVLKKYLLLLEYYLESGARCKHFFEIKHKELLYIFRYFYSKEDIARLFSPILSADIGFKTKVLTNYLKINSIKDLAASCGYSIANFHKLFKQNFGENPLSWLNTRKTEQIKSMLADKSIPIYNIADELGFSSPAHLTVFCKRHLGYTPSNIREKTKPKKF
jgi:AraC-like DNA-binding protein